MNKTLDDVLADIELFELKEVTSLLELDMLAEFVSYHDAFDRYHATIDELVSCYNGLSGIVIKARPLANSIFKVLQENNIKPVSRINGWDRYSFYNFNLWKAFRC